MGASNGLGRLEAGNGGLVQNLSDDLVGGLFGRLGFVGETNPMSEHIGCDLLHQGRADVIQAAKPRERSTGGVKGQGGPGGSPEGEQTKSFVVGNGQRPGAANERKNVAFDCRREMDSIDPRTKRKEFLSAGNGLEGGCPCHLTPAGLHQRLLFGAGVLDEQFEEKTVGLGFGEWVRAFLFDRV